MRRALVPLGGLALALTLPRAGLCFLAWFALIPLLAAPSFTRGLLFGGVFYGVSFYWIYSTCRFAAIPVPIALLAWAAFAALQGLVWALFAGGAARLKSRLPALAWPWACAVLWVGIEFVAIRCTPGVGLLLLEYTQWRHLNWVQGSALVGPHALGFLIVLWNASLAGGCERGGRRNLAATALLCGAWWAYGAAVLGRAPSLDATGAATRTVVLLQPNIDQYAKWDEDHAPSVRTVFDGLLEQAQELKPDLAIWPESALPGWFEDAGNHGWARAWACRMRRAQLVGMMTRSNGRRNSAALLEAGGEVAGYYHKRRLVPFGEFVPLRFLERFVGALADMGDLDRGPAEQPPLDTPLGPAGVTICFEALFPHFSRGPASRGARLLLNLDNDGWYKDTWGPYQHFRANLFRAVENRAWLLRAANTGISGAFDPYGRAAAELGLGRRGLLSVRVPVEDAFPCRSPYARLGDWFGWASLVAGFPLFGVARRR